MGGLSRRAVAAALGMAVALAAGHAGIAPAPTRAESALWTMVASPLAVTTGVATTFTLTATNEDPLASFVSASEIGCVTVDVPLNFAVSGAAVSGSNAGTSWTASVAGQRVKVRAASGGDRLRTLEWVRFTVGATATSTGSLAWAARAYRDQNCGGAGSALGVPPVVVVTGSTVTPSPAPTPTPKPTPSPVPTPTPSPTGPLPSLPLPTDPLPSVLPSLEPTSSPLQSVGPRATPRSSPDDTATPRPDGLGTGGEAPSPAETQGPTSGGAGPQPPGGGGADPAPVVPLAPEIRFEDVELDLGSQGLGQLGGIEVWVVPAAAIGTPGILVLLWVLLQSIGAAIWIPAARRLRTGSRLAGRWGRPTRGMAIR